MWMRVYISKSDVYTDNFHSFCIILSIQTRNKLVGFGSDRWNARCRIIMWRLLYSLIPVMGATSESEDEKKNQ